MGEIHEPSVQHSEDNVLSDTYLEQPYMAKLSVGFKFWPERKICKTNNKRNKMIAQYQTCHKGIPMADLS